MAAHGAVMAALVIFTDLDGTLLHPLSYSFDEARPALEHVRRRNIPLIFVSSKTRAEIEALRHRLDNRHPFISENGAGIFIPEGYFPFSEAEAPVEGYRVISLGTPYAEIRRRFLALHEQTGIAVRGFGDMSPEEVADLTGLAVEEAALARQRDFGEPFVFSGPMDERFLRAIEADGLHWTQGRLFHIMGDHDKGRAVSLLRSRFERLHGAVVAAGLGDGLNDLPLLRAVERPVLVRKEDGSHDERITAPGLIKTRGIGPAGWNEAVLELLSAW